MQAVLSEKWHLVLLPAMVTPSAAGQVCFCDGSAGVTFVD